MRIAPSPAVLILSVGRSGSCVLSRHLEFGWTGRELEYHLESSEPVLFTNIPARLASAVQLPCSWLWFIMYFRRRFSACNYLVYVAVMGSIS